MCDHYSWREHCPDGSKFMFTNAEYGRTQSDVCTMEQSTRTHNGTVSVLHVLNQKCSRESTCNIKLTCAQMKLKLCTSDSKYLNITYMCVPGKYF